jgi:anti-sigma factor RsiW
MDRLEDFLSGTLEPADERAIEAHLGACQQCRDEVRTMQDVSQFFVSLKSEEVMEPSLGFYASVMRQAEPRETPSFASSFALNFGRRLVFASLLTLAVLGSYLVSRESDLSTGPSPAAVMAQQNSPAFDSAPGHHNMLVTLTAYEQH